MTYMYKKQLKEECEFEYAQARTVLVVNVTTTICFAMSLSPLPALLLLFFAFIRCLQVYNWWLVGTFVCIQYVHLLGRVCILDVRLCQSSTILHSL